jgi:hypothetical protein
MQHVLLSMKNFNKFVKKHRFLTDRHGYSSFIRGFIPVERRYLESIQKMFWGNMIRDMIQSRFSFPYQWIALTKGMFFLAKNFSLSKLLICRVFGETMPTSFLTARMACKKSIQQLMSIVFHRVLIIMLQLSGL